MDQTADDVNVVTINKTMVCAVKIGSTTPVLPRTYQSLSEIITAQTRSDAGHAQNSPAVVMEHIKNGGGRCYDRLDAVGSSNAHQANV